jgi:hypothetical protein
MEEVGRMIREFTMFLLLGFPAIAQGQTSADLSMKYHQVTSYELRPGVIMTPRFAPNGQVCEMDIEKRHKTDTGIYFGSSFSAKEVRELVDELAPEQERGKNLTEPLNSIIDGGFNTTEYKYENILVSVRGITRPQAEDMVVIIIWRKRFCDGMGQSARSKTANPNRQVPVVASNKPKK